MTTVIQLLIANNQKPTGTLRQMVQTWDENGMTDRVFRKWAD